MEKESLTYKAFKNSSYSIFGHLWPIIFTLFVTPIIIFTLGVKEYGVFLFISTSMGLLGLFELGLYTAVLKDMSFYYGQKDEAAMKRLIHSANLLFFILALFYLTVSIIIYFVGVSFLPASFLEYQKYSNLFVFSGAVYFFSTVTSVYSLMLQALQRYDIINQVSMVSVTLSSLFTLVVVKAGGGIAGIFIVQLIAAILIAVVTYVQVKKLLPFSTFKLRWHTAEVIKCYRFGLVAFLNNAASTSLSSFDKLVIPFFVGPSNLTYYSMPGNIATRIPSISGAFSVGILPLASQLSGSDEISRVKTLYVRTFRFITIISGALTITTISFASPLLKHWLSADFADKSSSVLIILALTNFFLALFVPLSSFLLGLGKLKFLSLSSLFMALLNAMSLFILLPRFGIVGAAWAYLISVLPILYLFYYVETRFLLLENRKKYYIKIISGTLITSFLVWFLNLFIKQLVVDMATLLVCGGISVLLYVALYRLCGFFEEEDWKDIEKFFLMLLIKMRIKKLK